MRKHICLENNKAIYFIEVIKYIRKKKALISGKVCENVPYKFLTHLLQHHSRKSILKILKKGNPQPYIRGQTKAKRNMTKRQTALISGKKTTMNSAAPNR